MSIEEQRRKAFELWLRQYQQDKWNYAVALGGVKEIPPMPDYFVDQARGLYLEIWNAALDSVEIELPPYIGKDSPRSVTHAISACAESIEAAGLKVMP